MKNFFRIFGVVAIACTFLAAMCNGGEEEVATYKIKVKANPSKGGVVTGAGTYEEGSSVILTATPNADYVFAGWEDDANAPATRTITVIGDATYTANFSEKAEQSMVTVTVGDNTYTPAYLKCEMANNGLLIAFGQVASNQYPIGNVSYMIEGEIANGTYNGYPEIVPNDTTDFVDIFFGNPRVWYYENGSLDLDDTTHTGDWWGKTVTLQIENLDLTNLKANVTAVSTLAHVIEMVNDDGDLITIDFNDVPSKSFSLTAVNQQFVASSSKAIKAPKKAVVRFAK